MKRTAAYLALFKRDSETLPESGKLCLVLKPVDVTNTCMVKCLASHFCDPAYLGSLILIAPEITPMTEHGRMPIPTMANCSSFDAPALVCTEHTRYKMSPTNKPQQTGLINVA